MTYADEIHAARIVKTHHVVMFSGGVGSWATAKRVAAEHGTDHLVLLFADTLVEDEWLRLLHRRGGRMTPLPSTEGPA